MAYRYVDLAARLPSPKRSFGFAQAGRRARLALVIAGALVLGMAVGRAAHADGDANAQACPLGTWTEFWDEAAQAATKENVTLDPAQATLFVARIDAVTTIAADLPRDGSITIRILTRNDDQRFALAIDRAGCIRGRGFVAKDFLDYLLNDGPLPERYQAPGAGA